MKTLFKIILFLALFVQIITGCTNGSDEEKIENLIDINSSYYGDCSGEQLIDPIIVVRQNGHTTTMTKHFNAGDHLLCVRVKKITDKSPAAATISIDGIKFFKQSEFNSHFEKKDKWLELEGEEHEVEIKVFGKPKTALEISIFGSKDEPSTEELMVRRKKKFLLEDENPNEEVLHRIVLDKYMTPAEFMEFMQVENGTSKFDEFYIKVIIGDTFMMAPVKIQELTDISLIPSILFNDMLNPETEFAQSIRNLELNNGKILIYAFDGYGSPHQFYQLWEQNDELVRMVTTMRSSIMKASTILSPDEEYWY